MSKHLVALFDGWDGLCAAAGRRSLTTTAALQVGTADQRETVAGALLGLGYPEAYRSAVALGTTLRMLRGRVTDGRCLARVERRHGAIWYVTRLGVPGDGDLASP